MVDFGGTDQTHSLKAATLDPAEQQRAYTNPTLSLVPELVERLAAFTLR